MHAVPRALLACARAHLYACNLCVYVLLHVCVHVCVDLCMWQYVSSGNTVYVWLHCLCLCTRVFPWGRRGGEMKRGGEGVTEVKKAVQDD